MSDESLFREVDEEVRQEQYKKLWARYGNLVITLCLVVVGVVAGYKGWQYYQLKQSEAAGEAFFAAMKAAAGERPEAAIEEFKAIGHPGFGVLARLQEAALSAKAGKPDDAAKIYGAISADQSLDQSFRDLAAIRAAYVVADTAKPEDLDSRVAGFDAAGNPWRHAAREIRAVAAWRAADFEAANGHVTAILGDPETPVALRQRAQAMAELLVPLLVKE